MSGAWIKSATVKSGKRYRVYYRRGGRYSLQEYAGSFHTMQLARERKRLIDGELAGGRDPRVKLAEIAAPRVRPKTILDRWDDFTASRLDVSDKTKTLYRVSRDRLGPLLGTLEPAAVTPQDVQDAVLKMHEAGLSANTIGQYVSTLRQVLDFCDVEPNPARSSKVKLPSRAGDEPVPPSTDEWNGIMGHARKRSRLPLRLMECEGLRVSECVSLTFGDVDFAGGRLRISRARTKGRTAGQRWIPCPQDLLDDVADLVPVEDRHPDRELFPGLRHYDVRADLALACRDAGIAHYHPHDLRHRRISLWFAHGFDQVTIKTWAGHSNASMSSDTYGHVVVSSDDEWRDFWLAAYDVARRPKALERGREEAR